MNRRSIVAAMLLATLAVAGGCVQESSAPPAPLIDATAPPLPTLVDFWRPGCEPCRRMEPLLATLAGRHDGRIRVRKLDTSEAGVRALANELSIRAVPTQILVDLDGREVFRHVGFWSLENMEAALRSQRWIPAE